MRPRASMPRYAAMVALGIAAVVLLSNLWVARSSSGFASAVSYSKTTNRVVNCPVRQVGQIVTRDDDHATRPLHENVPCYEADRGCVGTFVACGAKYGLRTAGKTSNSPEARAVGRCVNTSLPIPTSIIAADMHGATVAVYGDGDIVSRQSLGGGWESINFQTLRVAAQQRQQWRESRLRHLGLSPDRARDAARADVVVIDIGANVGTLSVPLAHAGVRVLAVEAMPANQQLLHMSQCLGNLNSEQFQLLPIGLSNKPGKCQLVVSNGNRGDGNLHCGSDPIGYGLTAIAVVPLKKLDDVMATYDMASSVASGADAAKLRSAAGVDAAVLRRKEFIVKIDIEHHEYMALLGASHFFSNERTRPSMVVMEIWQTDQALQASELLLSWGYVMHTTTSKQWVANAAECATFFDGKWPDRLQDAYFVRPSGLVRDAGDVAKQTEYELLNREILSPLLNGH